MKLLLLLLSLALVSSTFTDAAVAPILREKLSILRKFVQEALAKLRGDVDQKLIDLFPYLKEQILKLHSDIDYCYDRAIGNNETIDILEEKIHSVVEKFFYHHGHLDIVGNLNSKQVQKRIEIFIENLEVLAKLLIKCVIRKTKGEPTVRLGLTAMSFYSREEFETQILNYHLNETFSKPNSSASTLKAGLNDDDNWKICTNEKQPEDKPIPERFSWQDQGYVSPVYDQLKCASCYVFSSTSALESQYMIRSKTKMPVKFSVQRTLNCVQGGCGGGQVNEVAQFFVDKGASLDGYAPYADKVLECKNEYLTAIKADTLCSHQGLSEEEMQRLLMRNGPASVAIDGEPPELQYLKDTPYTMPCSTKISHAVLLVGWDEKYWIIKNSWSENWGIKGYLYLPRGGENDNKCGVRYLFLGSNYYFDLNCDEIGEKLNKKTLGGT